MSRLQHFTLTLALACSSAAAPPPARAPSTAPAAAAGEGQPAHADGHAAHAHGAAGYHKDFSDAAGFSAHFDDPERDAWQRPEELLDLLRITPGSVVVDLGAGTGYFVSGLSSRVGPSGQVLALDVEPKMVEFLERRIERDALVNVRAQRVAPDDPGLRPGSVSRVLVVNTWHHIDARPSYAQKLRAALAPGGEVWVVDFTLESERGPPASHRLSAAQVSAELEQGGLRPQIVEESLPEQYVVRALR
jgi:predicted methyltransferase